jgi:hypothetical protein
LEASLSEALAQFTELTHSGAPAEPEVAPAATGYEGARPRARYSSEPSDLLSANFWDPDWLVEDPHPSEVALDPRPREVAPTFPPGFPPTPGPHWTPATVPRPLPPPEALRDWPGPTPFIFGVLRDKDLGGTRVSVTQTVHFSGPLEEWRRFGWGPQERRETADMLVAMFQGSGRRRPQED